MRKAGVLGVCIVFVVLCYLTFVSAKKIIDAEGQLPKALGAGQDQYRLVLITQDMETPFWDKVSQGAMAAAQNEDVSLEVWGSYNSNKEDFLKNIELAIQSKVDGIIIQGLDSPEFKELTKVKASFYGIPVITVANDVPMEESLRRTYVGSNQYEAGKMIARELLKDLGQDGKVVLMYDSSQEYYQLQRRQGMEDLIKYYNNLQIIEVETQDTREQVMLATQDVFNRHPDTDAFIAVNANMAGAMLGEISKRSQVEPYYIYTFDDGPESLTLLEQGKLDGVIEQSPEEMGRLSVQLMIDWLKGKTVPLDKDGYLTDINIRKVAKGP